MKSAGLEKIKINKFNIVSVIDKGLSNQDTAELDLLPRPELRLSDIIEFGKLEKILSIDIRLNF